MNCDVSVFGSERPPVFGERRVWPHVRNPWLECRAVQMFDHQETREASRTSALRRTGLRRSARDETAPPASPTTACRLETLSASKRRKRPQVVIAVYPRQKIGRARRRLYQIIEGLPPGIGAVRTVTHAMHIHDGRNKLRDLFIGEAQPRDRIGAHVMNEDLRLRHECAQLRAARFALQVEHDRALVAVQRHVGRAHIGVLRELACGAVGRRSGLSILITSAPRSPSICVA